MPTTVEEFVSLVLSLQARVDTAEARAEAAEARVAVLEVRCEALEKENAELKARLGKNSSNSSKPPSSDSPYKAKPGPTYSSGSCWWRATPLPRWGSTPTTAGEP